jgi:hypothetical protein
VEVDARPTAPPQLVGEERQRERRGEEREGAALGGARRHRASMAQHGVGEGQRRRSHSRSSGSTSAGRPSRWSTWTSWAARRSSAACSDARAIRWRSAVRWPGRRLAVGQRGEHRPLGPAQAVPHGLVDVARLGECPVERDGGRVGGVILASVGQVEQHGRQQHRALGVAAGERDDAGDGGGVEPHTGRGGQGEDVADRLVGRQRREVERPGLAEQGSLAIGEQRPHERRRAAGVHVRRSALWCWMTDRTSPSSLSSR